MTSLSRACRDAAGVPREKQRERERETGEKINRPNKKTYVEGRTAVWMRAAARTAKAIA